MHLPALDNIVAWPTLVATWGAGGRSERHAHHAMHLLVALSGTLRVDGGAPIQGVFVPADEPHAVDGSGACVLTVFVEPESATGRALAERWGPRRRALDALEVAGLVPDDLREPSVERVSAWLESLIERGPARVHPRVGRVLARLREGPLDREHISAVALASIAGLSVSRFLHVFKESTGTSLRQYLLWSRLQRSAAHVIAEGSLTDAAHAAGFSDGAHMTRSFRRLFGVVPSELIRQRAETGVAGER